MKKITATAEGYMGEIGETFTSRSLVGIYKQMCSRLRVSGPRGLSAVCDTGAEIQVSLYEGGSYIRSASGSTVYRS